VIVAALFVDPNGIYPQMPNVDCWDERCDARKYDCNHPVVCHPPCSLWISYAYLNYARWGGEHNRPGNDGGCFASAVRSLHRCGGVLEHPAFTRAFAEHAIPAPVGIGWNKVSDTDWVCEIWQSAYGHKARKRTWLYYRSNGGVPPLEGKWDRPTGTHQIGRHDVRGKERNKPTVSRKEAIGTPPLFAEFLVQLARRSRE